MPSENASGARRTTERGMIDHRLTRRTEIEELNTCADEKAVNNQ